MAPNIWRLARGYDRPATTAEQQDVTRCEQRRAELLRRTEPIGDVHETASGRHDVTTVGAETQIASCPPDKALFIYRMVRTMRPRLVVEFGSALGVSGSYIASALRANGSGRLITVEGSPSRQAIAAESIESVAPGVTTSICGFFEDHLDVLDGADLFFNDGNHNADAVQRYADAALERMARPSVLLLDDALGYSEEMVAAWERLRADRRFTASTLAKDVGVLSIGGSRARSFVDHVVAKVAG